MARSQHPLYQVWRGMMKRCYNPKAAGFRNYGGRGIGICKAWQSFETFAAEMPPRPSAAHTIDRFPNNNGDYEPGNVRWATKSEQRRNCRYNRLIQSKGVTRILEDWSTITGIPKTTLFNRLKRGWSDEEIVTTPAQPKAKHCSIFPPGGTRRCIEAGMNLSTVAGRLRRSWSFERAISTPPEKRHATKRPNA